MPATPTAPLTLGIRQENPATFEARVPLTPEHLSQLLAQFPGQLRAIVQPSELRTFSDDQFRQAGAIIQTDLSEADLILGVKTVYPDQLIDGKTHLVFAHVIKGQPDNMPILQQLLDRHITLIDYEAITDARQRRLVFFGYSAGQTGMFETLRALGNRLTALGQPCLFQQLRPVYDYGNLAEAEAHLAELGQQLRHQPELLGLTDIPLVFGFAGLGNVGQGAQSILRLLPSITVLPQDLPTLFAHNPHPPGTVFNCPLTKADTLVDENGQFDPADYQAHPHRYRSALPQVLPYLSVLLNCVFWGPQYPRLLPQAMLRDLWRQGRLRLQVVGDLSCDPPAGSMGCTVTAGDLRQPVFDYHPETATTGPAFDPAGLTVMAVDNLSAGLPRDASVAFSDMLLPFLSPLIRAHLSGTDWGTALPEALHKGVITQGGELSPRYRHLYPLLPGNAAAAELGQRTKVRSQ